MTEQYYYTDPLAAAWMKERFGMKFLWRDEPTNLECSEPISTMLEDAMNDGGPACGPYQIHPDSLHLLKARRGDVVEHLPAETMRYFLVGSDAKPGQVAADYVRLNPSSFRIIQRDGKAFMSPESEEA